MRLLLLSAVTALVAVASTGSTDGTLTGSLAFMRCGSHAPSGVCHPGAIELAAMHLGSGNTSLVLALPNATDDTLDLQNLALVPRADALFISVAGPGGGQLLRLSLSTRQVVSTVRAPACAFLAVDDVPAPTSALCLTDAPYYGEDGRSYLLRVALDSGEATLLATWDGSPVPVDVVAVYAAGQGVLYADLADKSSDSEFLLGWDVSTGELVSQVAVQPTVSWLAAVWDAAAARLLGVLNNYICHAAAGRGGPAHWARGGAPRHCADPLLPGVRRHGRLGGSRPRLAAGDRAGRQQHPAPGRRQRHLRPAGLQRRRARAAGQLRARGRRVGLATIGRLSSRSRPLEVPRPTSSRSRVISF